MKTVQQWPAFLLGIAIIFFSTTTTAEADADDPLPAVIKGAEEPKTADEGSKIFHSLSTDEFISSSTCTTTGVIGCRAFNSISDITDLNDVALLSPNAPLTNSKCRWNGGDTNCYPVYESGNCTAMDAAGQRSQSTYETASLWSPCYDEIINGARLTFWNDLGSSVQLLNAIEADINASHDNIWSQYEIKLSPEFFFSPEGTTSAKLYRIVRKKTDACRDERFSDHRFLLISPDAVRIGPVLYCSGISYAGSETAIDLDKSKANHWLRLTTHINVTNSAVTLWVYDVTAGELLSQKTATTHRGERINFTDSMMNITGLKFTHHSTSHDPNPEKPSPHYWIRNVVLSANAIDPSVESPHNGDMPPTIVKHPVSQAANSNESINFSVTASGDNLSYQWLKDETSIAGATSAIYQINAVEIDDAGIYKVTVSNNAGTVSSHNATLTVDDNDNDGLPDQFENRYPFLNPNDDSDAAKDQDNDGLTNHQEFRLGTDLTHEDSDRDGLPDKTEVDNGLDPTDGICPPWICPNSRSWRYIVPAQ